MTQYKGYTIEETPYDPELFYFFKEEEDEVKASFQDFKSEAEARACIDTIERERNGEYPNKAEVVVLLGEENIKSVRETYPDVLIPANYLVGLVLESIINHYFNEEYFDPDFFE